MTRRDVEALLDYTLDFCDRRAAAAAAAAATAAAAASGHCSSGIGAEDEVWRVVEGAAPLLLELPRLFAAWPLTSLARWFATPLVRVSTPQRPPSSCASFHPPAAHTEGGGLLRPCPCTALPLVRVSKSQLILGGAARVGGMGWWARWTCS